MSTQGSSPVVKRLKREADCSPQSSAEVKKEWSSNSIPSYAFLASTRNSVEVCGLDRSGSGQFEEDSSCIGMNQNVNLEKVHFVGLYCIIAKQRCRKYGKEILTSPSLCAGQWFLSFPRGTRQPVTRHIKYSVTATY